MSSIRTYPGGASGVAQAIAAINSQFSGSLAGLTVAVSSGAGSVKVSAVDVASLGSALTVAASSASSTIILWSSGAEATFTCALTAPVSGAILLQGHTVTITGTISRAATVAVSKGSTWLGAATVSGLSWSYSYQLLAGDVGSITFNATATATDGALAVATGVAVTVLATLPLSFWTSATFPTAVGRWTLSSLVGTQNSAINAGNAALTSLSNANTLTPSTGVAPKLQLNAVGGKNGARMMLDTATNANFQYFSFNAFSAVLRGGGPWTVFLQARQDRVGDLPLWSCLRSDGSASEQLFGRFSSEFLAVQKKTPAGGTQTLTAARHPDPYSDTMVAWVFDGTNLTIYSRAAGQSSTIVDSLGALDTHALSAAVDRFTVFASVSSIPFEANSGFFGESGLADKAASSTQIGYLFDEIKYTNYVSAQAVSPNVSASGASRTMCIQDEISGAGWRDVFAKFCYENGLSFYTYAQGRAGTGGAGLPPFRIGDVGNSFTSAQSGQDSVSIYTQAVLDINNSPGPTRLFMTVLLDGDNNAGHSTNQCMTDGLAACVAIMNAGLARDPAFRIALFDLPPLQDPTLNTGAANIHTAMFAPGGLYDQIDALYPHNKVFRPSWWTIEGGVWSAQDYGADAAHLNHLGCVKGGHVLLNSKDADGLSFGAWLLAQSPSAPRRVPFSGSITSHTNGFSIPRGTPVTVAVDCSRLGFNSRIVAGSNSGTCVPVDIYDTFLSSGFYAKTPHPKSALTFTPSVGDVGPMTISATFTDVDGVTTATVSITGTVT